VARLVRVYTGLNASTPWVHSVDARRIYGVQIETIVCPERIETKIESKHHVTFNEARHILFNKPRIRFAEKGHTPGEGVYAAFGQTLGGRYLSVFFIYKPKSRTAVIISARDMSDKERKAYGRK
jgi:uncharacterized DUF497 family protein